MTRNSRFLSLATATVVLLSTACQKDELTVVSTASAHDCAKTTVELNVDSLVLSAAGGWGNEPHLHYTICECDTIAFVPVNIQEPWYVERWVIESSPDDIDIEAPVLDTITVATDLWLDVHNGMNPWEHVHVRIEVVTETCE